ncbi:hypothetical protein ACROYT_G003777 [Oculina patagonica]
MMNMTFQTNNASFNMDQIFNSSSVPQNKENITSNTEETPIQFVSLIFASCLVITLVSLFGNSVIIHIIRTKRSMKTTTNYLILSQACSDLWITVAGLLEITLLRYSSRFRLWFGGPMGLITCNVFQASLFIPHAFSVWILTAIAVERFHAVTRPLRLSPISRHLKKTIVLLWVWCCSSAINILVKIRFENKEGSYYCDIDSYYQSDLKTVDIIVLTLNVFAPLLLICVLYSIVCVTLWSREVPGEGPNQNDGQAEALKVAKQVTRMMIVVVVLYAVCWVPSILLVVIQSFGYIQMNWSQTYLFAWFTLAYSGLNPYIYYVFNQKFRNGFKDLFGNYLRKLKIHSVLPFRSQSVELEQI